MTRRLPIVAALALITLASTMPTAGAQGRGTYFDVVDTDHDGRVSHDEFIERMSWAFRQMDRNADQVLSTDEQLVPNAPVVTLAQLHERLTAQFRRQDRNRDGWLSAAEFLAPPA